MDTSNSDLDKFRQEQIARTKLPMAYVPKGKSLAPKKTVQITVTPGQTRRLVLGQE